MSPEPPLPFAHPYRHGFVRTAVAVPSLRVADPAYNAAATLDLYHEAAGQGASLVVFPELGLTGYSCDDLFHQRALLTQAEDALATVVRASADHDCIAIVGLPLRSETRLFNCAAVVRGGTVVGVVPKSYLPNYGEFYEARQFSPSTAALASEVEVCGQRVPFGSDLLFRVRNHADWTFHVEICEDLWVPIPPSCYAALAGATMLVNLSASNVTIGKADYRRQLVASHSARCIAASLYTAAGYGESTTDLAWDGQALIGENGTILAESERFSRQSQIRLADVDLELLAHERMRQTTFGDSVSRLRPALGAWRRLELEVPPPKLERSPALRRPVARFPYVPADPATRDARCAEVFQIQVQSLARRLEASGIERLVIGVSGGLDSALALLVCARTMDFLGLPRTHIHGFSLPGFATGSRTRGQAAALATSVGCTFREIDITPSCRQMLADIGHPFADGKPVYDVTFENVQAGERTSHLFRLANQLRGLVVGTGDLSELALGWCTYGVGDQMSHYGVNASVPKTLVRYLVDWVARQRFLDPSGSEALQAVLDTIVSPELVPASSEPEQPEQSSEASVGPYELQDFHLYQVLRYGFGPAKVAFLAWNAWGDAARGSWPADHGDERRAYDLPQIKRHLQNFLQRFFATTQFKRSCIPNAAKVGSGGSLSPRGDWRAPSDSVASAWLQDLASIPDGAAGDERP